MNFNLKEAVEILERTPLTLEYFLDKFVRGMTKRYREDVGPWAAYLGVLKK